MKPEGICAQKTHFQQAEEKRLFLIDPFEIGRDPLRIGKCNHLLNYFEKRRRRRNIGQVCFQLSS